MADVYEEIIIEETPQEEPHHNRLQWEAVQSRLNQATADIREALNKGVTAAEPVFREKVAPVLADATAKLSELTETARKATAEKAGFEDTELSPTGQIGHGLTAIASGLLGLTSSLADFLSEHAKHASEVKAPKVDVEDDVKTVAEILNEPVVFEGDGEFEVVEPI